MEPPDLLELHRDVRAVPVVLEEDAAVAMPRNGPRPPADPREAVPGWRALEGDDPAPDPPDRGPHGAPGGPGRSPEQIEVLGDDRAQRLTVALEVVLGLIGVLDPHQEEVTGMLDQMGPQHIEDALGGRAADPLPVGGHHGPRQTQIEVPHADVELLAQREGLRAVVRMGAGARHRVMAAGDHQGAQGRRLGETLDHGGCSVSHGRPPVGRRSGPSRGDAGSPRSRGARRPGAPASPS